MKTIFALGVAALVALAALTVVRLFTPSQPAPARQEALASLPQDTEVSEARPVTYRVTSPARPTRPIDANLLSAVEAETDPDSRGEALERAAQSVSAADLRNALDVLASDPNPAAAELRPILVRRWAETEAPAAAAWAAQLPEGPVRGTALEQVSIAWANSDLPAAAEWVQAMPPGGDQQVAAMGLGYEAARSEPATALVVAGALPPGPQRDDLLVHAVSQWAAANSVVATDWATQVPDVQLRERLLAAIAISSAKADGAAAANLAVKNIGAGGEQNRAAVAIVQRWAQSSPNAAAAWVAQWPASPVRDAAAQSLLALGTPQGSQAAATPQLATP